MNREPAEEMNTCEDICAQCHQSARVGWDVDDEICWVSRVIHCIAINDQTPTQPFPPKECKYRLEMLMVMQTDHDHPAEVPRLEDWKMGDENNRWDKAKAQINK